MKKAGELLSFFFDEKTLDRAQEYSELFASWTPVVQAHSIPAAADHSRIVEFERHILLIEVDHPGWIQLLQTKQRDLLRTLRRRFPDITGISFRLSRTPVPAVHNAVPDTHPLDDPAPTRVIGEPATPEPQPSLYDTFEDQELKAILQHLHQGIMARNKTP